MTIPTCKDVLGGADRGRLSTDRRRCRPPRPLALPLALPPGLRLVLALTLSLWLMLPLELRSEMTNGCQTLMASLRNSLTASMMLTMAGFGEAKARSSALRSCAECSTYSA